MEKFLMGFSIHPWIFPPASLQEHCLHNIFIVSQFAGFNQCVVLPQLLYTANLQQAMHAGGPKVEIAVLF